MPTLNNAFILSFDCYDHSEPVPLNENLRAHTHNPTSKSSNAYVLAREKYVNICMEDFLY